MCVDCEAGARSWPLAGRATGAAHPAQGGGCPTHVLDHVLDRKEVAAEAVHIDFLRHLGGLPSTTPRWLVLAEFGRRPLLLRWLALAARWWERMKGMHAAREDAPSGDGLIGCALTVDAFSESVRLFVEDPACGCWAAEFLRCMRMLGVADATPCTSVAEVLALDITEESVRSAGVAAVNGWWVNAGCEWVNPRTASGDRVWASTYRRWVQGAPDAVTPHLKAFLTYKDRRTLMRLRVGSYPLRVCTGRNEGSGAANATGDGRPGTRCIPRTQRTCKVCGTVEDLKHFLLECPAYAAVKGEWAAVFEGRNSTAMVFMQDQPRLCRALRAMLQHRAEVLGLPWQP